MLKMPLTNCRTLLILFLAFIPNVFAQDWKITEADQQHAILLSHCNRTLEDNGVLEDLAAVHEHLEMYGDETSLRTLYQWANEDGYAFKSYEEFVEKQTLLRPYPTREGGLNHFLFDVIPLYAKVIGKSPERIQTWSKLAVEAADKQSITKLALRFSPGWLTSESKLDWNESLQAVLRGMAEGLKSVESGGRKIELQLYLIATREINGDHNEEFVKTVNFYLANRKYFAAFDIAGSESLAPIKNFYTALIPLIEAKALDPDIHFTFHAGEEIKNSATSMKDAIHAEADRLGHGINGGDDPELHALMQEHEIMIEVCPTSNCLLGVSASYSAHPLPYLIRSGFSPSISTDDPLTFSLIVRTADGRYAMRPLSLHDEYAYALLSRSHGGMGLSLAEILQLKQNGHTQFDQFQPKTNGAKTLNQLLNEALF